MDSLARDVKQMVRYSWRLFSLAHRAWAKFFTEADLNTSTFPVIEIIIATPGVTQQEIADELSIDKSCTSRACRYLETNGFIRREKSEDCTHGLRCYPLEKALCAHKEVLRAIQTQIHDLLDQENPAELEAAIALMARLVTQFKNV